MEFDLKRWRDLSPDELCTLAGFSQETTNAILAFAAEDPKTAVHRYALSATYTALRSLPAALADILVKDEDKLVQVWMLLCQMGQRLTADKVLRAACDLGFWSTDSKTDDMRFQRAAQAFAAEERPTAWGSLASDDVYGELMRQHAEYGEDILSPYTTFVGPSGVGKSFAVKQLALRHGLYVVYSNLSSEDKLCYPRPVTMGIPPVASIDMVGAWVNYLENQIALSQCCKEISLTAPGLFELFTSSKGEIVEARMQLELLFREKGELTTGTIANALASAKGILEGLGMNRAPILPPCEDDQRPVILCFDEARALLDHQDHRRLRTLCQAATLLAAKEEYKTNGGPSFFLVLLDTTVKISSAFEPAYVYGSSSKITQQRLLPPIHRINTLDVFAPAELPDPTGSEEALRQLFSCGRPLWGAFIQEANYAAKNLVVFATSKIQSPKSDTHVHGIAVLSYRMRFYISSPALSEELVASMMRYIVAASKDRISLLTNQPSEPVLAFAASRILQEPATRLACIRAWIGGLHSGAVNPGDIGEQVAALILCFGFDYAARPKENLPHAIAVQDLMEALFGTPVWDALAHNSTGATNELLETGLVFYNHFVRASRAPTLADLEVAHRRGVAIVLPSNFPGMDVAIPVRMPAGEKSRMGLLLVQVQNRVADAPTPGLKMHMTEDLRTAVEALGCSSHLDAIVGLVLCLRTNKKAQFSVMAAGGVRRRGARKAAVGTAVPTELLGIAFGLDTTVYPCLKMPAKPPRVPAAKKQKTTTTTSVAAEPEMEEICSLLRRLLGSWPDAYAEEDTASLYAQRLLDPFYDGHRDAE